MDLAKQLQAAHGYTASERVLAAYLLEHPDDVARISSRELARRTYTSPSAVLRFARKLGFASYRDFQASVVEQLKTASLTTGVIVSGRHAVTAINKMAELEAQVVEETRRKLSVATFEFVSALVEGSAYIDLYARDQNATTARYAAYNLTHAAKVATVYDDADRMLYAALQASADHVAFLVSRQGHDRVLVTCAEVLRERGIPTVVVTADASSPLALLADHVIEGYYLPEFDKLGEVIFAMVVKYVFDVVFAMAYARKLDEVQQIYERFVEKSAGLF